MKDKIVKFFNKIKNHAVNLFARIKRHFVKHKQRYMRVLLVILCVYLVLLALCSIGRCTRKNVVSAETLGGNTDTYFEVPVIMLYNSSNWADPFEPDGPGQAYTSHTCVVSNPIYLRLSRNLDFLGVSSVSNDGGDEFHPSSSSTHYSFNDVGCTHVLKRIYSYKAEEVDIQSASCTVTVDYVKRLTGSYPAITQCNVVPSSPVAGHVGYYRKLRVELVNWTQDTMTEVCVFEVTVKAFNGSPFYFLGYDIGYGVVVTDSYSNGYASGREAGYNEGYSRGYANGSQSVGEVNQFTALMNAIVFVPINTLWNVLNFEFLGVNVFMFVTAVITVLVVIWLWGKLK